VIDYIVEGQRPFVSRSRPFDEAGLRDLAGRVFDRTVNLASTLANHFEADGGERWRERLGSIHVPTLVIHGTDDPLFPYGNAMALAQEISDASVLAMERVGHELPREAWDVVTSANRAPHSGRPHLGRA